MGKLGTRDLKKLLSCVKRDPRVVVPPLPGFDSGVHLIDDETCVVISTDPCTDVPQEWFGWLLIHYAASDVALFGAKPQFCTLNLLGPLSTEVEVFYKIMKQACNAAEKLGMIIITGHTGRYSSLLKPVGVCTAYGTVKKDSLVTPDGINAGDLILCTKPVGLETVVNFALAQPAKAAKLLGTSRTRRLSTLVSMQSCIKEALQLSQVDGVHALHDTTEGGLTAALNEMADAANVGFQIDMKKIRFANEITELQNHFGLSDKQILSMSSTGTVLSAVSPSIVDSVLEVLKENSVEASILGTFTKEKSRILVKGGKPRSFPKEADDPYEVIVSENP